MIDFERMERALLYILEWKIPEVLDRDGKLCSYASLYGSNGERDHMKSVARAALSRHVPKEESEG